MMKREHEQLITVFSRAVHEKVSDTKAPFLETIMELAPVYGIDEEEVGKYLTDTVRELLREECQRNFLFKPSQKAVSIEEFMS